jgi:hypothetical protein
MYSYCQEFVKEIVSANMGKLVFHVFIRGCENFRKYAVTHHEKGPHHLEAQQLRKAITVPSVLSVVWVKFL